MYGDVFVFKVHSPFGKAAIHDLKDCPDVILSKLLAELAKRRGSESGTLVTQKVNSNASFHTSRSSQSVVLSSRNGWSAETLAQLESSQLL